MSLVILLVVKQCQGDWCRIHHDCHQGEEEVRSPRRLTRRGRTDLTVRNNRQGRVAHLVSKVICALLSGPRCPENHEGRRYMSAVAGLYAVWEVIR